MNDYKSWEAQTVDEIIAAEARRDDILMQLSRKNELFLIAEALGLNTARIEQQIEGLESELSDIQKVAGNE